MINRNKKERFVISVGGSLVIPDGGVDVDFVSGLNKFIRKLLQENAERQFFIVIGGGKIARRYRDAGKEIIGKELTSEDMDWLGIHATRLNAHLLRTVFRDIAHPFIIKNYDIIRKVKEPVAVAAGWKPGWSTDFDAVLLCEDYGVDNLINLTNIEQVYDKDPGKHKDAKPIDSTTWKEYRKLAGDKWTPGLNMPFDPVAAKRAEESGIDVAILKGNDWDNLEKYLKGDKFTGTIIK